MLGSVGYTRSDYKQRLHNQISSEYYTERVAIKEIPVNILRIEPLVHSLLWNNFACVR